MDYHSPPIFLYALAEAPKPPQWLLEQATYKSSHGTTQASMNNWGSAFTERELVKDGKIFNNAFNHSVFLDDDALNWAKQNVSRNTKDIRIASTLPGLERCGAHIDRTRNYTLMYLMQSGSDEHETVFYKEKNQDELIRPREYHVDDYERLETIATIKQAVGAWNLIHSRVLHSIENIKSGRVSIQISLDEIDDLKLTTTKWHYV